MRFRHHNIRLFWYARLYLLMANIDAFSLMMQHRDEWALHASTIPGISYEPKILNGHMAYHYRRMAARDSWPRD